MFSLDVEVTEAIGLRLSLVPWFKGNVTIPEAIRHVPECGGECDERALCEVTPHARDTKHWAGRVSSSLAGSTLCSLVNCIAKSQVPHGAHGHGGMADRREQRCGQYVVGSFGRVRFSCTCNQSL